MGRGHEGAHGQGADHGLQMGQGPSARAVAEDVEGGARIRFVATDPHGFGIAAVVAGKNLLFGTAKLLEDRNVVVAEDARLRDAGARVIMFTGDARTSALATGRELGLVRRTSLPRCCLRTRFV